MIDKQVVLGSAFAQRVDDVKYVEHSTSEESVTAPMAIQGWLPERR